MAEPLGYSWLIETFGIEPVQPLRRRSEIGAGRRTFTTDGYTVEVYAAAYRPDPTFEGHMTFALKYEGVYPEVIARLVEAVPEKTVVEWAMRERLGQYARRTAFLWEWFSGRHLAGAEPVPSGNYIDAVDADVQLAATKGINNPRWRVRDNLPGTRHFCPAVFYSQKVAAAAAYDCAKELEALNAEFGADILLKSAVWLTIKESRSSFNIEHAEKNEDDIKRFAVAMEKYCGTTQNPVAQEFLAQLQHEILGKRTLIQHFGLRQSPVFVGSVKYYENVVHYVAPHWDELPKMLEGLSTFLERTQGASPVVRAAVYAFGFVYIHPMADGNGRVHRFLINDVLRRDGAVPAPYILPVSATITHSAAERAKYDQILDVFSKPFMAKHNSACEFTDLKTYPDGIQSDFKFCAYPDSMLSWSYMDFTAHVEYLSDILEKTIRDEMSKEASILRDWETARAAVKKIVDGPDQMIDRLINSIRDNGLAISNKLRNQYAILNDPEVAGALSEAVGDAFAAKSEVFPRDAANDDLAP